MKIANHIFSLVLLLSCLQISAQNLASLGRQEPIQFSGNIHLSSSFYGASKIDNRRSPFAWVISGSPSVSVYGLNIPFSFSVRNQQSSISKPFQRFGASPHYKWLKLHFGYRSMSFSPYTLSGRTFLGGGIELSPGKFRLAAMYGKFQDITVQRDTLILGAELIPTYQRIGFGAKIGFASQQNQFEFIAFKARDDVNDALINSLESYDLQPAENFALGLNFKLKFFNHLSFKVNSAASAFTSDRLASDALLNELDPKMVRVAESLMEVNSSTRLAFAGDAELALNLTGFSLGLQYKRVEPLYTTLGAYYLRDDYENITVNTSISLLQRKLHLRGNFGIQRNNLYDHRSFTNLRKIASVVVSYHPGGVFGLSMNYANYQIDQQDGLLEVNDTLRFAAVSKTMGISPNLNFKGHSLDHGFNLSLNRQTFEDLNEYRESPLENVLLNGFLNYRLRLKEKSWRFNIGLNYNSSDYNQKMTTRYGLSLGSGKELFDKKVRLKLSTTYNLSQLNNSSNGNIWKMRLSAGIRIKRKHRMDLNAGFLRRNTIQDQSFSEWRGRLSYSFGF